MTQNKKRKFLTKYGFIVGARDPLLNTNYPGKFMVTESYEENELPTEDSSNGPWCITGDDLDALVDEGCKFLANIID